jgi:hypothetical protein
MVGVDLVKTNSHICVINNRSGVFSVCTHIFRDHSKKHFCFKTFYFQGKTTTKIIYNFLLTISIFCFTFLISGWSGGNKRCRISKYVSNMKVLSSTHTSCHTRLIFFGYKFYLTSDHFVYQNQFGLLYFQYYLTTKIVSFILLKEFFYSLSDKVKQLLDFYLSNSIRLQHVLLSSKKILMNSILSEKCEFEKGFFW